MDVEHNSGALGLCLGIMLVTVLFWCQDTSDLRYFGPFVGVWKRASVTNFIILGLRSGNRVRVRISNRVRVSIRLSVSG